MDEREFTELKIKLDYLLQELTQIKQEMRKLIELSEKQISMSKDIELLHEKVMWLEKQILENRSGLKEVVKMIVAWLAGAFSSLLLHLLLRDKP